MEDWQYCCFLFLLFINLCATFADEDNTDEEVLYQSPQDNISNGMYDLSLHFA